MSQAVSLKPKDAIQGGGLLDDADVLIKECRFKLWDYNGSIPNPIFALGVVFEGEDGSTVEQFYSAGDTKHYVPSQDGKRAQAVGTQTGLNEGTNAMMFLASLVNSGFPEDKISDDVSVFEGTRVHVNRVPQPVRKGLKGVAAGAEPKTILIVTKILAGVAAPAGKKAAPKAAAGAQAQAAPAQESQGSSSDDLTAEGQGVVMGILAEKGGSVTKQALAQEAFKALAKNPNRNKLVQLVFSDAFLSSGPWQFDGSTISM